MYSFRSQSSLGRFANTGSLAPEEPLTLHCIVHTFVFHWLHSSFSSFLDRLASSGLNWRWNFSIGLRQTGDHLIRLNNYSVGVPRIVNLRLNWLVFYLSSSKFHFTVNTPWRLGDKVNEMSRQVKSFTSQKKSSLKDSCKRYDLARNRLFSQQ